MHGTMYAPTKSLLTAALCVSALWAPPLRAQEMRTWGPAVRLDLEAVPLITRLEIAEQWSGGVLIRWVGGDPVSHEWHLATATIGEDGATTVVLEPTVPDDDPHDIAQQFPDRPLVAQGPDGSLITARRSASGESTVIWQRRAGADTGEEHSVHITHELSEHMALAVDSEGIAHFFWVVPDPNGTQLAGMVMRAALGDAATAEAERLFITSGPFAEAEIVATRDGAGAIHVAWSGSLHPMHPLRRTSLADAAQGGVYWSMQTENGWMRPSYLNTGAAARVHLAPTGLPRLLPAEDGSVHAAWVLRNLDGNEVWHARLPPPLSNAP